MKINKKILKEIKKSILKEQYDNKTLEDFLNWYTDGRDWDDVTYFDDELVNFTIRDKNKIELDEEDEIVAILVKYRKTKLKNFKYKKLTQKWWTVTFDLPDGYHVLTSSLDEPTPDQF